MATGLLPLVVVPWAAEISQRTILAGYLNSGHPADRWLLGVACLVPFLVLAWGLYRVAVTPSRARVATAGTLVVGLVNAVLADLGELLAGLTAMALVALVAHALWPRAARVRGALTAFLASEALWVGLFWYVVHSADVRTVTSTFTFDAWLAPVTGVLAPLPVVAGAYVAWRLREV